MEAFVVSARKYRPQHFNTVVGQSHITDTLKNAILNNQLAQAYLFCGPRGVGKTTCARIFAKTINCSNLTSEGEACDTCESCRSFNEGTSLNVYELDAASNNSVEDIRNLVDQVRFAPQLGAYKVYIIDEVHMLSQAAFNAFLKTLEEPPKHAKFILATTEKHKIIPTILSRCQVFSFNRIRLEDISSHLAFIASKEHVTCEADALHIIAQKAEGGLRDACSIFDQMVAFTGGKLTYKSVVENLNVLDYDYYFSITEHLLGQRLPEIMVIFDTILKKGFDGHQLILGLGDHFRNLMVSKDPQTVALIEGGDGLREKYLAQAQQCPLNFLLKALSLISKTDVNYRSARNQRLLVEITLMQLAYLTGVQEGEKKNDTPDLEPRAQVATKSEPEAPVVRTASKPTVSLDQLKFKSSFSITGKDQPAKQAQSAVPEAAPVAAKHITEEEVISYVRGFGQEKQNRGSRQLGTIFLTAGISLKGSTIEMTINNETQREQLLESKQAFIDKARADLQHSALQLEIRISDQPVATKAYKPMDIFKEMAERNPQLLELKKRFDLEIDY